MGYGKYVKRVQSKLTQRTDVPVDDRSMPPVDARGLLEALDKQEERHRLAALHKRFGAFFTDAYTDEVIDYFCECLSQAEVPVGTLPVTALPVADIPNAVVDKCAADGHLDTTEATEFTRWLASEGMTEAILEGILLDDWCVAIDERGEEVIPAYRYLEDD